MAGTATGDPLPRLLVSSCTTTGLLTRLGATAVLTGLLTEMLTALPGSTRAFRVEPISELLDSLWWELWLSTDPVLECRLLVLEPSPGLETREKFA